MQDVSTSRRRLQRYGNGARLSVPCVSQDGEGADTGVLERAEELMRGVCRECKGESFGTLR